MMCFQPETAVGRARVGFGVVSWQGANKNMKSEGYLESIPESFSSGQSQIFGRRDRSQVQGGSQRQKRQARVRLSTKSVDNLVNNLQ
jgi:hypothetical protein